MTSAARPGPLLEAAGLVRRYRRTTALGGVDLRVDAAESVALLGPNGAGKTTLLTILAGLDAPTAGALRWNLAPRPGRGSAIGWVPQRPAVYGRLTPRENLRLFAALEHAESPRTAAERLLERADLVAWADRPARELSTGTLQRLNIAVALAGGPRALLLDEPSATLSPDQRIRLWNWLTDLRTTEGMALMFATQSVEEAARHADRCVVIAAGRVAFSGTVGALIAGHAPAGADPREAGEQAFLRVVEDS